MFIVLLIEKLQGTARARVCVAPKSDLSLFRDSSTPNVPHIANVVDVYKDLMVKSAVSFVQ